MDSTRVQFNCGMLRRENKVTVLDGHTQKVETLKFSPDGETLVSTGQDGTILLCDWNEVLTGSSGGDK